MANKYRQVKFTLKKELIIIVSVLAAMILATILLELPTKEDKFVDKWSEAGASISENTLFVETSFDKLDGIISKNEKVFVLFATTDENGVSLFGEVMENASTNNVEKVYIIDSAFAQGDRDEDADLDAKLDVLEAKYGINLDTNPNLWYFNNGTLAAELNQTIVDTASGDYCQACYQVMIYNNPTE